MIRDEADESKKRTISEPPLSQKKKKLTRAEIRVIVNSDAEKAKAE